MTRKTLLAVLLLVVVTGVVWLTVRALGAQLVVRVLTSDGKPAPEAMVSVKRVGYDDHELVMCDRAGEVTLGERPPGRYQLFAVQELDAGVGQAEIEIGPGQRSGPIELRLVRGVSCAGRITAPGSKEAFDLD